MIRISDFSTIDDYLARTSTAVSPTSDSPEIVSQPLKDFYIRRLTDLVSLGVTLCDWGSARLDRQPSYQVHITHTTQSLKSYYIGAPWGLPVDIWNLSPVLLEVHGTMRKFVGRAEQAAGVYQTKHHLEEMVALFGPFSSHLLAQGNPNFVRRCFDEQDGLRDPIPRPAAFLQNRIESLDGDDKDEFDRFLKAMMKIGPGGIVKRQISYWMSLGLVMLALLATIFLSLVLF